MLVTQAFRFELDPSNRVRSALASYVGAARYAYNWGLDHVEQCLDARRGLAPVAIRQGASVAEAGRRRWPERTAGRPTPEPTGSTS